jgi:hypothetical protein
MVGERGLIRTRLRRFASCLLPLGTLAVLVGLVLGAGHFFAWMRGAGQTRVTVTERMPSKAIGVHAVMDWPADRTGAFQQSPMWDAVPGLPPVADRLPMRP